MAPNAIIMISQELSTLSKLEAFFISINSRPICSGGRKKVLKAAGSACVPNTFVDNIYILQVCSSANFSLTNCSRKRAVPSQPSTLLSIRRCLLRLSPR